MTTTIPVHTPNDSPEVVDCPEAQACVQQSADAAVCQPQANQPPAELPPAPPPPKEQPPAAAPDVRIYTGQTCSAYDKTCCTKTLEETFSLRFNGDGTLTMFNISVSGNTSLFANLTKTLRPSGNGIYVEYNGSDPSGYTLRMDGDKNGLTYLWDWVFPGGNGSAGIPCHWEGHFDYAGQGQSDSRYRASFCN